VYGFNRRWRSGAARLTAHVQPLLGGAADIREAHTEDQAYWREAHRTNSDDLAASFDEAAASPSAPVLSSDPRQKQYPFTVSAQCCRPGTRAVFSGAFGASGFHNLMGPTADGRVMRWNADLGSGLIREHCSVIHPQRPMPPCWRRGKSADWSVSAWRRTRRSSRSKQAQPAAAMASRNSLRTVSPADARQACTRPS
jgi:hypothetical protein